MKTLFFIYVFIWIRWTLPRFRFDQLMQLGWKFMLPVLLAYILVLGATVLALSWQVGRRPTSTHCLAACVRARKW